MINIRTAAVLYWTYIFELTSSLDKIVKLRNADERAPKDDIRTRKAAHVPLLSW